jgi:outer membrane protein OmpA-like peptidoglycan-associated protein
VITQVEQHESSTRQTYKLVLGVAFGICSSVLFWQASISHQAEPSVLPLQPPATQSVADTAPSRDANELAEYKAQIETLRTQYTSLLTQFKNQEKEISALKKPVEPAVTEPALQTPTLPIALVVNNDVTGNPAQFPTTLVLASEQGFTENTTSLSQQAKKYLQSTFPMIYAELMKQAAATNRKPSITVSGHSSPTFNKRPIDPTIKEGPPYEFNVRMSEGRARLVANFLASGEIGEFPERNRVESLITVVGRGYESPVPFKGDPKVNFCGAYDCPKSRRVEIRFELTGDGF